MKTIIHVNQHVIKKNRKSGSRNPVITCKTYKENAYGHQVVIYDKDGNEAARVIYSPDKPLSCGAHVWIETLNKVEVISEPVDQTPPATRGSIARLTGISNKCKHVA